jgi:hypothetical protein
MIKIFSCRRSSIALIGIVVLGIIAIVKGHDVSMGISTIVLAVAGSNAYQAVKNASKN